MTVRSTINTNGVHMNKLILFFALLFSFSEATGQVFDEAGILTDKEEQRIIDKIQTYEKTNLVEIGVTIPPSLEGRSIFHYSVDAANRLGVGKRYINNGILVAIAPAERQLQILVGYGLEYVLGDLVCDTIRNAMTPELQNSNFEKAIMLALDAFISRTNHLSWSVDYHSIKEIYKNLQRARGKIAVLPAQGIMDFSKAPIVNNFDDDSIPAPEENKSQYLSMKLRTKDDKLHTLEYTKYMKEFIFRLTNHRTWTTTYIRIKETDPLVFQLLGVDD